MRLWLSGLAVFTALTIAIGCASVTPQPRITPRSVDFPFSENVAVKGLVLRDERPTERLESRGFTAASARATMGGRSAIGTGLAGTRNSAILYEAFDNPILQQTLRHAIEDARFVERITDDSKLMISGELARSTRATTPGQIAWDVFNTVSLLVMFGVPCLGSMECEVELRMYSDGKLVASSTGCGRATWSQHGFKTFDAIRHEAQIEAAKQATIDAFNNLCDRVIPAKQ